MGRLLLAVLDPHDFGPSNASQHNVTLNTTSQRLRSLSILQPAVCCQLSRLFFLVEPTAASNMAEVRQPHQ